MTSAILSFVPIFSLVKDRRSLSFVFTLVGMLCYVAMLALTFAGNMPLNRRMLEMDLDRLYPWPSKAHFRVRV